MAASLGAGVRGSSRSTSRGRLAQRATVVLAVMGVVASYGVAGPLPAAFAATVTGSNFEIDSDANLVVNGSAPAIDWLAGASGTAMRSGVLVRDDLPSGQTDDSFTSGTHEDSATPTIAFGSIPPNKNDLTHFGVYVEKHPSSNFVNVFWTRMPNPTGDVNFDFEFNQSASRSNAPSTGPQEIPVRTVGDILISYDLQNGGNVPTLTRRTWDGSTWGSAMVFDSSQAIGSINSTAIAPADSGGLGALDVRTFGEASVNLAALVPNQTTCLTYGSVYVKSRSSGSSFDAALKDFIAPEAVAISNCGTVKIHKTDDKGVALKDVGFTLFKDVYPFGVSRGPEDTTAAGTCTTDSNGDCTITDVKKGDYWLVETTVPAGHDPAPDQFVHIASGDQVVSYNLVDPIQYGTITVTKVAIPQDAQPFSFTLDGNGFQLEDPATSLIPSTISRTVVVGSHSLSEVFPLPSGWVNTSLVCSDPTHDTTVSKPDATVNVSKGETVACTYTNTFTKLAVHLATQAVVAQANTSWNDTATLTGDGTHPVTGTVTFFACDPQATATACTTGGSPFGSPATVSGGGTTYGASTTSPWSPPSAGWTCFRAEFTSSSPFYANDTHTNAGSECFLKNNANLTVTKTAVAAYGRTYHWTIGKAVDQTHVDIADGGKATFTYTVTVGNTHTDNAWTVTGKVTVTNPNPVPFTGVDVTDAIDNGAGACTVTGGAKATVPANHSLDFAYTCTYTGTPSPSFGTNTATATWDGTAFFTTKSSATGTATVDFSKVSPSTTDSQVTVTDTNVVGVLGTVDALKDPNPKTFTYSVDRNGVAGTCTAYDNTATFTTDNTQTTGTASKSVTVCVGSNLAVSKTVTATLNRDDLWSITKDVDQTRVSIAAGGSATFHYTVTVTPTGHTDNAYAMSGSIHVTNPNDWEDVVATVTDASNVGGGVSCVVSGGTNVTVPKGSAVDLPYTCTFSGAPTNGTNLATATWSASTYHTPAGTASGSAPVIFAVGNETHKTITVVDDKTDPANPVTLGSQTVSDGAKSYTYSLPKLGVAGTCTSYTNTAVIQETGQSASKAVTVCVGLDLKVAKTALATDHRTYLWKIAKDVDQTRVAIDANGTAHFTYTVTATPDGLTKDGWSVTGQITVTNPNDWESINASVDDSLNTGGGGVCSLPNGTSVVVPAGQSVTVTYSCTFSSQPADGTNTATATWDKQAASTPNGSATGTATVVFVPATETNKTITVVDDKTDPAHPVTLGTATWGETPTAFTYTLDKQGVAGTCTGYTNTATISETGQSASKTVTVCVGSALVTSASGAASFNRAFNWTIGKSVDKTKITINNGQTATFNYTVTVTPAGITDSGYAMGGSVTVTNPNDWEDVLADVTVTSDVGGGVTCTVTDGVGRTVSRGGSLTLPYTCSFTGAPSTTGTTTATAAWDSVAASTSTGSAVGTVPITFAVAGETNRTITVVDDKTDPAHPVTLGTWRYDDGVHAFTYGVTKSGVASTCTNYTNTAVINETAQSAKQTVTLCDVFTGGGGHPVVTPKLPFTGDYVGFIARMAIALLAAGLVLLLLSRKCRRA